MVSLCATGCPLNQMYLLGASPSQFNKTPDEKRQENRHCYDEQSERSHRCERQTWPHVAWRSKHLQEVGAQAVQLEDDPVSRTP
jgi:hypothetical protein